MSHIEKTALFAVVVSLVMGTPALAQVASAPAGEAQPAPAGASASPAAAETTSSAAPQPASSGPADGPWRAHEALGAPRWLRFGLSHRTRFENLWNDFHTKATGDSRALSLRTLLSAEVRFAPLTVGIELQDSRAYASAQTPLNTTIVNPIELLQAYAILRHEGLLAEKDAASLKAGRFTVDVGSRRLAARNEFRNTINAFTGVDAQWTTPGRHLLRAFAAMPMMRFPDEADALADNDVELDRENADALFSGIFFASAPLAAGVQAEAYVFGLHERDSLDAPSSNRRLYTPGARVFRPPAKGQLDFQAEAMLQVGTSRASKKETDTKDLSHRAWGLHLSGGHKCDAPWSPRVALHFDYGSGDRDPADDVNGRFDTLFAARRFEFGPTGLYGAFGRTNMISPALRVEVAPHRTVDAFAAYRPVWLASRRDSWVGADLRDAAGGSGRFVGQQIEGRIRWNVFPKNLALEVGAAYLAPGGFAADAPGARQGSPVFVYTQVTGTI